MSARAGRICSPKLEFRSDEFISFGNFSENVVGKEIVGSVSTGERDCVNCSGESDGAKIEKSFGPTCRV